MNCTLCGNNCQIDREKHFGKCKINTLKIARYGLHYFEEPIISGKNGSGTIFFCGCPLSCVFCQNHPVSKNMVGKEITVNDLAKIFEKLEKLGAHNINLVNPTHFVPEIIEALNIYRPNIPIVYNTHGYDSVNTIESLKGYVDIYLPDFKYYDNSLAEKYSNVKNYKDTALLSIKKMREQVKDQFFDNNIMKSGLVIRHLILPTLYKDSINVLKLLKENFPTTTISIMSQYTPCNNLSKHPEINRKLFSAEISRVEKVAEQLGINGYIQEKSSASCDYIPSWDFDGLD